MSGSIGLAATIALSPWLRSGTQIYEDIVAGEPALQNYNKMGDYWLIIAFLVITSLVYLLSGLYRSPSREDRPLRSRGAFAPLIILAVYSIRWLWSEIALPPRGVPALPIVLAGVLAVLFAVEFKREPARRQEIIERTVLGLAAASFAFLTLVGVATALGVASLSTLVHANIEAHVDDILRVCLLGGAILAGIAIKGWISRRSVYRLALLAQVGSPLVLLAPFTGVYEIGGTLQRLNVSDLGQVVGAGLSLAALLWSLRGVLRALRSHPSLGNAVLPMTVLAVAVVSVWSTPAASASLLQDDFHTGESIIQWQQIFEQDHRAFLSFVPIPGLIGVPIGWLNETLYAGTAASYPLAWAISFPLVAAGTAWLLVKRVGTAWALLFAGTLVFPSDRMHFVLPTLLLLSLPGLLHRPPLWLASWGVLVMTNAAVMPSTGLALAVGTIPLALWVGGGWIRRIAQGGWAIARDRTGLAGLVVLGALLLLFLPHVIGLVSYLREGQRSNTVAYGTGLYQYFGYAPPIGENLPVRLARVVYEGIRSSGWTLGFPLMLGLGTATLLRRRGRSRGEPTAAAAFALGTAGFLVAVIPYAMGRIDPISLSRHGVISIGVFALLLPIATLLYRRPGESVRAILALLVLGASMWGYFYPRGPKEWIRAAVAPIRAQLPSTFVDGSQRGLPSLGRGMVESSDLDALVKLDRMVRRSSDPWETYYDATNRSLLFYELGRRVPTPYSGPYYAADARTQERVIEALESDPPPLVWMQPQLLIPFPLRAYRVHRWFVEQGYRYAREGSLDFLVRPDRLDRLLERPPPLGRDPDAAGLTPREAGAIPVSWGSSFDHLASRFRSRASLAAAHVDGSSVTWDLPPLVGPFPDFLRVRVRCSKGPSGLLPGRIEWRGPAGARGFSFQLREGEALVPLGIDAVWLTGQAGPQLRMLAEPGSNCGSVSFNDAELLRLVN